MPAGVALMPQSTTMARAGTISPPDEPGDTRGRDEQLGPPSLGHQVTGRGVADHDRGVAGEEQREDGASDDGRASDDHGTQAGDRHLVLLDDRDDRQGRGGNEGRLAARQAPGARRRGAVDVLLRVDVLDEPPAGGRVLERLGDDDAGDARVRVQPLDGRHERSPSTISPSRRRRCLAARSRLAAYREAAP